tara:strand:- start:826 stop:1299 length:474 start_codon:yes stop_codon:yes gene_type:complete
MSWDNWTGMVHISVMNYYHSEYHKNYMKKLKKELKYLRLQEANNEIFKYIKEKKDINFLYNVSDNSSEVNLLEYNINKIFRNYRLYWLINEQRKFNNRIETISELLDKYFKSLIFNKFIIYHKIDYLDNYKCRLVLKIYNADNVKLIQNDQTIMKDI